MAELIDAAGVVAFAARFGPPNIMAFENGRCLHPDLPTPERAIAWLEAHHHHDIYIAPAALRDAFVGKPRKADCLGAHYAWVDVDPPKGSPRDAEAVAAWQRQTLADIDATDLPRAQIVVSSGRGLWLYWRLPCQLAPADVEAINYALASRIGGGDACHNIDRVARAPFTVNTKTGLVATILRDEVGTTPVEALPSQPPPISSGVVELGELGALSPPESKDAFRALVAALPCPDEKKLDLLLSALNPEAANDFRSQPLDVNDRSAVMFSWAIKAVMAGMEPNVVRDCILSPAVPAISAHLLDNRKCPPSRREAAAVRQVTRAHAWARDNGWEPPSAAEARERAEVEAIGLVALAPIPADLPARPWLVENLLMDGQVTMLTGRGGDGKSLLALQLAVMVATRVDLAYWHARERRNVLVLNAEDDIDEQRRRLLGACDVMEVDPRLLEGRLFTMDRESLVLVHRDPEDGKVKPSPLYDRIAALIEQHNIGLVVIDPLVEAHVGMDENSNSDMKELVVLLRRLARARNLPLLVVHHSRKGASGGDQDGARGGSALVNACRVVVTLDRMNEAEHGIIKPPMPKERYVRVTGAKANYAGRIGDRWLELVPVELLNGDWAPGLRRVPLGEVDEGFDVHTWEHKDELLAMVRDGRGGGRLWSTATRGPTSARLDAAMMDRLGLDAGQAREILARLESAGLVARGEQKGHDRKETNVWLLPSAEMPEGTVEMPF